MIYTCAEQTFVVDKSLTMHARRADSPDTAEDYTDKGH